MLFLGGSSAIGYGLSYGLRYGLVLGVVIGVIMGVAAILTGSLNSGWSRDMVPDQHLVGIPNKGIQDLLRHAFFAAGCFGLLGGIVSGAVSGLAFWLSSVPGWETLLLGLTFVCTLIFSVVFWMTYGGLAVIEHYTLRWHLSRAHCLPWRAVSFLEHAADHALLHKVGGGYIFAHRLLQDHFTHREQN